MVPEQPAQDAVVTEGFGAPGVVADRIHGDDRFRHPRGESRERLDLPSRSPTGISRDGTPNEALTSLADDGRADRDNATGVAELARRSVPASAMQTATTC